MSSRICPEAQATFFTGRARAFFMDRRKRPCYTHSMKTPLSAPKGARRAGRALLALLFVMAPCMGVAPGASGAESSREVPQASTQQGAPAGAQPTAPAPAQAAPAAQNGQDGAIVISNDAPGYNGYAGTWRDPETGDIVTSVIAPRRPREQAQQPPIYVAPQIDPDWPANGYGNSGWPNGWNGGWNGGAQPGWTPGAPPGGAPGWGQSWRPGQGPLPPGMGRPPSAMVPPAGPPSLPPQAGQPGGRPPQQPDRPGPGGLPLPGMQPGMQPGAQPPQGNGQPGAVRPPANGQQGNWQGPPPNWRPQNWRPQNWQPGNWQPSNWQPHWQGPAGQSTAWRPWGPAGAGSGVKAWTPGQPPHGDWQPLSWSPGPAGAAGAWNPWQPYMMGGMMGAPMGAMMGGMRWPGRFAGMPQLPPNISRHLGPVVPLGQRGGPR